MAPEIFVYPSADALAEAFAVRLSARLGELQGPDNPAPAVSLTGGRIALRAYERLSVVSGDPAIDWSLVQWWWSDERYVAAGDDDRNDTDTIAALTSALSVPRDRLHPMPSTDSGLDLDAAADAYAAELDGTAFDITVLGVGPDGHVASLFPDHEGLEAGGEVIAVRNSPKPPPNRISVTLPVLNGSREVWFLVSGTEKADAVRRALLGGTVPAGRVNGIERTVWLLDSEAAAHVPEQITS